VRRARAAARFIEPPRDRRATFRAGSPANSENAEF